MTKTRESLSIALALTFFGAMLLMPEPAQAQNCAKHPDHPKCVARATPYAVSLTGAFAFDRGSLEVNIKKENVGGTARSDQRVEMTRPADDFFVDGLRATWDAVFAACAGVFDPTITVESLRVGSDDWRIDFIGEINQIRLVVGFFNWTGSDGIERPTEDTGVFLQLIGDTDYATKINRIPPDPGDTSVFELVRFSIAVPGAKRKKLTPCQPRTKGEGTWASGSLDATSTLSITAPAP